MKRRFVLLVGMLGLLAGALCVAMIVFLNGPINEENYDKVKRGMTEAEVEAILGAASVTTYEPDGNHRIVLKESDGGTKSYRQTHRKRWQGRSMTIQVRFIEGGTVAYASIYQLPSPLQ